ncbi:hypothetical protein NPIL_209371 [Nephila pilipes]|uniref:Uncharacterized protein n=1 Tax=Nephila pilipes TaxID=299642 RepID=A0A8X6T8E6_NEPPI|nr:hypothetical protein NPIL_209371 [Nephila pilipes]
MTKLKKKKLRLQLQEDHKHKVSSYYIRTHRSRKFFLVFKIQKMDPKREEKHRIRANFGQKRVGGGVNREQKQRGMEGRKNNGARVRSPLPVERTVKPLITHGQNVLALQ